MNFAISLEKRKKVLTNQKKHDIISLVEKPACMCRRTGDYREEGTPVPIPNTEVKLFLPDDTMWATAWENRKSPSHPPTWVFFCYPLMLHSTPHNNKIHTHTLKTVLESLTGHALQARFA